MSYQKDFLRLILSISENNPLKGNQLGYKNNPSS